MKKLRCIIGLHKWEHHHYTKEVTGRRICIYCEKAQVKGCASPQDIGWFTTSYDEFMRVGNYLEESWAIRKCARDDSR